MFKSPYPKLISSVLRKLLSNVDLPIVQLATKPKHFAKISIKFTYCEGFETINIKTFSRHEKKREIFGRNEHEVKKLLSKEVIVLVNQRQDLFLGTSYLFTKKDRNQKQPSRGVLRKSYSENIQ